MVVSRKTKSKHTMRQSSYSPTTHVHVWLITLVCAVCFCLYSRMIFWKAFLKGFCIFYLQICAIVLTSIANSSYNDSPHFYIVPKGETSLPVFCKERNGGTESCK